MVASQGRQQPRPTPSKWEVKGEVYGTANSSQYNVDSPLEEVDFWGDGMEWRGQLSRLGASGASSVIRVGCVFQICEYAICCVVML